MGPLLLLAPLLLRQCGKYHETPAMLTLALATAKVRDNVPNRRAREAVAGPLREVAVGASQAVPVGLSAGT